MNTAEPIPKGYHRVTACLILEDVARAIDFYKNALGANEIYRFVGPDGTLMHAEIEVGDTKLMLGTSCSDSKCLSPSQLGGTSCTFYLYLPDADAAFEQAVRAGATVEMKVEDTFWGDRMGQVVDPFGHHWSLATHKEDLSDAQIRQRAEEFFSSHAASR